MKKAGKQCAGKGRQAEKQAVVQVVVGRNADSVQYGSAWQAEQEKGKTVAGVW